MFNKHLIDEGIASRTALSLLNLHLKYSRSELLFLIPPYREGLGAGGKGDDR